MNNRALRFVRRLAMGAALLGTITARGQEPIWPTHPDETERELEIRRAVRRELNANALGFEAAVSNAMERAEWLKERRAERRARMEEETARQVAEEAARAEAWREHRQRGAALSAERSGSGGTITARGKTVTIAPGETMPATKRGEPPAGMVWVFPETSARPRVLAAVEPDDMAGEQVLAAEEASRKRVLIKYPFLADKADPRRKQLDEFLAFAAESPSYDVMFSLTGWREYAADECALIHGWPRTERDFSTVFAPSAPAGGAEAAAKQTTDRR